MDIGKIVRGAVSNAAGWVGGAIGGTIGIPTTPSYSGNEFQLTIDEVISDEFSGWSLGTLQILDSIDEFIDGETREFTLKNGGSIISIVSSPE